MKRMLSILMVFLLILPIILSGTSLEASATQSRYSNFNTSYALTGNPISDIIAIALAQDQRTGDQFGYTEDWCADFISDCANLAGQSNAIPANGSVYNLWTSVINAGGTDLGLSLPQPGDLAIIDWNKGGSTSSHIELVYSVSGTTVKTVGGNTGSTGSLHTNRVTVRNGLQQNSGYFSKFVRPNYGQGATPVALLSINPTVYPAGTLTPGAAFNLAGTVSSNYSITDFKGEIITSIGELVQTASCSPNSYSVDIRSSNVNQYLEFGQLTDGAYKLRYFARDASGNEAVWDSYEQDGDWFYVGTPNSNPDPQEDPLSLTGAVMPLYLHLGNHFSIRGTITSTSPNITNVTVQILDSSGNVEFEKTVAPNSTSFALDSIAANIPFENLSTGTYFFRVSASTSFGTEVLYYSDFDVVPLVIVEPTPEDPDPEEPVIVDQLTLSGANYPTEITIGDPYVISGTVTSGESNISSVTVGIFTEDGESVSSRTETPDATSFEISSIDRYVKFGDVPRGGVYRYRVIASNASHEKEVLLNKAFLVTDSLKLFEARYPSGVLIQGAPYELWGNIKSASNITHVTVGIYKLSGEAWKEVPFSTNVKEWNIKAQADKYFSFGSLSSGSYYYRVLVSNATFHDKEIIGTKFYVKNNSHTHSMTRYAAQEASCTAAGNIEYWQCAACSQIHSNSAGTDQILQEETVIPVKPHSYVYEVAVEPTEQSEGTIRAACSVCGDIKTCPIARLNTTNYYYDVVTPATCTTTGIASYTWKAINYGTTYVFHAEIPAMGHDRSYTVTTEPTVTSSGLLTGACSRCTEFHLVTLPTLNDTDYSCSVTQAASCTEDGLARYSWKTETYGHFEFDGVLSKLGHSYQYKVTSKPTTSSTGMLVRTCARCTDNLLITLPKLNTSDYEYAVVQAPACTENGLGRYTWKETSHGSYSFDQVIPMTGHSYVDTVVEPTCATQGYTLHICAACRNQYKDSYVAALGHIFSYDITTKPTLTAAGLLSGICARCDTQKAISLPALNSTDYDYKVVKTATCLNTGNAVYTWKDTSYGTYSFPVVLDFADHSYESVVTQPSCSARGYTTHTCTVCGESYRDSFTAALGHDHAYAVTVQPDETSTGVLTGTCSRCGDMETVTLPKLNSTDYSCECVSATCTENGLERWTWKNSEYVPVCIEKLLPQLGHNYISVVTEPSCTAGGYTTHRCSRCQESYVDSHTDALGHDFGPWQQVSSSSCTEPGRIAKVCSRCSASESIEIAALGHLAGAPVQENYIDPTATANGSYDTVVYCQRCESELSRNTTILPATGGETGPIVISDLNFKENISLGSELVLNFRLVNNAAFKAYNFDSYYMAFIRHNLDGSVDEMRYGEGQPNALVYNGSRSIDLKNSSIAAAEMGVVYEVSFHGFKGDQEYVTAPMTGSLRDYFVGQLETIDPTSNNGEARLRLAADTLLYGAKAQAVFNPEEEELLTGLSQTAQERLNSYGSTAVPTAQNKISYSADGKVNPTIRLSLQYRLEITVRYTNKNAASPVIVEYWPDGSDEKRTVQATLKGSTWNAAIGDIGAAGVRDLYHFRVLANGVPVTNEATWSIESYIAANRDAAETAMKELYNAILNYSDSVNYLFAPTPTPSITYTVTFVDYDGTVLKTQTVEVGQSATPPSEPTRNGYIFGGWEGNYTNVHANVTVTAIYRPITDPAIIVNTTTVSSGERTVSVTISLLNNPGISSLKIFVGYDSKLTLTGVSYNADDFGNYVTAPEPFANPQAISLMSPLNDNSASGDFATLTFSISDDVSAGMMLPISVEYDPDNTFNVDFDEVVFQTVNGAVIIK